MSDDLVERLRDRRVCSLAQNSCRNDWVCEQAADRIEKLEAKLAKAVDAIEEMQTVSAMMLHIARFALAELKGQDDE